MRQSARAKAPPRLLCRLRTRTPQEGRRSPPPFAGEIELENVSSQFLEIPIDLHPLQYLDLIVTGPDGSLVSGFVYGNLFSPLAESVTLRLLPGEKYVAPIALLGNVPPDKQLPGCYTVKAVYECGELRAESEPFVLCVQ